MKGIRSKLLILLGASLLLAGPRPLRANIVDFGPGASGKCILGIIDDPEPWPSAFKGLQSGSMHLVFGTRGEMYLSGPSILRCDRAINVPVVTWETRSPLGTGAVLRYASDGAWSEPAVFTDREARAWDPSAMSFGTVRLSRGSLREEGSTMTSSRLEPSVTGPARKRPSPPRGEDGPPAVLVSPVTGATVVVWSRRSAAGLDLVTSEFAGGTWSEPRVVAASPENERDPQLVAGADGTAYLLYWVDGDAPGVLVRQASGNLQTWSPASRISQPGEIASRPAGAVHEGILHVAYERHDFGLDRSARNVVLAWREGDGWITDVLAVSQSALPIRPRPHSEEGRLWVDWDDGAGAAGWVRRDADGDWEPPRYERVAWSEGTGMETRDEVRARALRP